MSNPEKTKMDTEGETNENSDDSDYLWSDEEEGEIRELVCALPALRVSESPNVDEVIRNKAVVAAQLIVEAAKEAVGKTDQTVSGSREFDGNLNTKNARRPRVLMDSLAGASGSTAIASTEEQEPIKKAKKKDCSILKHPPQGPPKCNICGRFFSSWKAVFGHLRSHKDRGYQGFMPPPTFNAAEEGFGTAVAASSRGGGIGLGTRRLDIDLNVDPPEEEEMTGSGSGSTQKIDLNRSLPQDEEEKDKEDKAD